MNDFSLQLAEALRGSNSGNNEAIQHYFPILQQMMQQPLQYCEGLINIIKNDTDLRSASILQLTKSINANFTLFPPDFQNYILSELINFFVNIDNPDHLRLFVPSFFKLYQHVGPNWEQFNMILVPNPQKISFQVDLIIKMLEKMKTHIDFIFENMSAIAEISLFGLQNENWDLRLKCVHITSLVAGLDPEAVENHISLIISLIKQSLYLPEVLFFGLWIEFYALLELVTLNEEQLAISFQVAFSSLGMPSLSTDAKLQALSAITLLPLLNEQSAIEILNHSFNLALIKAQTGEFLNSASELFVRAIVDFGPNAIYSFLRTKIMESISSNSPEAVAVSLFVVKTLVQKLDIQIREDWNMYLQLIQSAAKVDNVLLLQACMMFISSLGEVFERQILESHLFAELIIPLIAHPSVEVRHHARLAMYNALNSVSSHFSFGVADQLWSINSAISGEFDEYLALLAAAIEKEECGFETEKSLQICHFLLPYLQQEINEQNEQMVIGALSIFTILLMSNESVHEVILFPTLNAIDKILVNDKNSIEIKINALKRMSTLLPSFRAQFPMTSIKAVESLIMTDNNLVVEQAATCFVIIAKEIKKFESIANVVPTFQKWIVNEDESYFTVAVTAIVSLAELLPIDCLVALVKDICEVAAKNEKEEVVSDCFDAVAAIVSKTIGQLNAEKGNLHQLVSEFSFLFLKGGFKISHEKTPLECNFDLSTLMSFVGLLCEDLRMKNDGLNRTVFGFLTQSLIASQNVNNIDMALCAFGDGIRYNSFNTQEISFIKSYVKGIFGPQTDPDLVHSIAYVLLSLLEGGHLSPQSIDQTNEIVCLWWTKIIPTRETMTETLTNLAILIWALAIKFGKASPEIFGQTFAFFPPESSDDTKTMKEMIVTMVDTEIGMAFANQIAAAIANLLMRPRMLLVKMKIDEDIVAPLGGILARMVASNPTLRDVVVSVANGSQTKMERILNYLKM